MIVTPSHKDYSTCDKVDYKRLGPSVIRKRINDATFRLDLPANLRLHPVFHISLLEPHHTSSIPNRVVPPPTPLQLADGLEYEVASILDSKIVRKKLYYLAILQAIAHGNPLIMFAMLRLLLTTSIIAIPTNPALHC